MNYIVRDFNLEADKPFPSSSAAPFRCKNLDLSDDQGLLELLWRDGPVVRSVQSDRFQGKLPEELPATEPVDDGGVGTAATETASQLFMEEDEMASWLHYQIGVNENGGGDLYGELLDPSPRVGSCGQILVPVAEDRPLSVASGRQGKKGVASGELTVVSSNGTPSDAADAGRVLTPGSVRDAVRCSAHVDEMKRKAREGKVPECHCEDVEYEYGNKRKYSRRSASARTRAAEVHNLSERRRRDRINEKMKALQELIPRCNKSDKASMLDDAIEYLKSLQLQVQMMSMQYNMGPMMFPDTQRYLPTMGFMGIGMGMGMTSGMEIGAGGLQRPVLPLGSVLPCPPIVGPAPAHPRPLLVPSFHSPNIVIADHLRPQASNRQDLVSNSTTNMLGSNMVQIPNVADSYHPYVGLHHLPVPSQSRAVAEPGTRKETDITQKSADG